MKKKLLTLLVLISALIGGVNAQEVTIFDDTMADWIAAGAQNDSEQKTPLVVEDGTVAWIGGKLNNSSAPNAGTSSEYPNYIRFGSDGNNLQINPSKDFSKGGKMMLTFTANTTSAYIAKVFYVKGEVETLIGDINATGKTINSVNFDLPESMDGDCTIKVTRSATTIFIYGIVLKTNEAGPSNDATIKTLTVAENEVTPVENAYAYELPASFAEANAPVVITPNSDKAIVTVSSDVVANTIPGAYTASVAIGTSVTITVTPETGGGEAQTYTLIVTKATQKSSDTSLKSLTVDGAEPILGEDGNYTFGIAFSYAAPLAIVATPNDDLATVSEITSPTVAAGTSEEVKFTVTAEDETIKEYTLIISRAAASVTCELASFSINGFVGTIDEAAKTIAVKVIQGYDFSHTPVMVISELATAAWDKDAKKVTVTAQDGTTTKEYTVSVAAENIAPLAVFPTELSFAAATYTEMAEWIYGAAYSVELKDATDVNIVGGYELKKESDEANVLAGASALNITLAKCGELTVNVGATGGRYVVLSVNGEDKANVTLTTKTSANLVCTIDKDEPVTVVIRSYKNSAKEAATGGTRIYSMNVTAPTAVGIGSQSTEKALTIYAADGVVYVSTARAQVINVYSMDGRLVKAAELSEGDNRINGLNKGIYLISNQKVVVK